MSPACGQKWEVHGCDGEANGPTANELPRFFRWVILPRILRAGVGAQPSSCYQQVMHSGFLRLRGTEAASFLARAYAILELGSIFW
jgi:hypothetical protein